MPDRHEYSFLGTHLTYKYNILCILNYDDEFLSASSNPFTLVILAAKKALLVEKIPDLELMCHKLEIAKSLIGHRIYGRRKISAILNFLNNYVLFEHKETNFIFEKELDQLTGKIKTMNIFEQVAEIKVEEKQTMFVENLLKDTDFSHEKIASLADVSIKFIKQICSEIEMRTEIDK